MVNQIETKNENGLKPISKSIIRIYAFLAILIVVIPEWIAELTISIQNSGHNSNLPKPDSIWANNPDLKLSTMNIKELRFLAAKLKLIGYSGETRKSLSNRLLKKIRKKKNY